MEARWWLPVVAAIAGIAWLPAESRSSDSWDPEFKVSLGYHYSAGTYGTSSTTYISYVPLIAKVQIGPWAIRGTLPYLRINGPGGIVQGPSGPIQTTAGTSQGLGDILLRGSYLVEPFTWWMPFVELFGLIKFPTASRSKGLGTGKFDFGIESELTWVIDRFVPFATVGYRVLGSPPGEGLDNVVVGSIGAEYRVIEPVYAGVFLDYGQAPSAAVGRRFDVIPFASWQINAHWSADLYASAGLAKGSPDGGTGLQVGYHW